MNVRIIISSLMAVAMIVMIAGCATGGSPAKDAERIDATLTAWKAAILAKDVDALMATYSDCFSHDGYDYEAEDKAALEAFVEQSINMGYFDEVEVSWSDAETEIEDKAAIVYPVDYVNAFGEVTVTVTLTKEKGAWLISDMLIEGL